MDNALSIGRAKDNDVVLPDTYTSASNHHARIIKEQELFFLEDQESKNGTFVSGRRISKMQIFPDDEVYFGEHIYGSDDLWKAIRKKFYQGRTDFKAEFSKVMEDFSKFERQKGEIFQKSKKPLFIRFGLILLVIGLLMVFPDLIPDNTIRYAVIISVGIIGSLLGSIIGKNSSQKNKAFDLLKSEYDNRLVCPKCNYPLLNKGGYHYWMERKTCVLPNCNATYA